MRRWLFSLLIGVAATASAGDNVVLVLDASGSMWGQIDGRTKVEIARDTIADLVADWRPENQIGLVAYGHRRRGDCQDIETVIEPGPLNAETFLAKVNGLNAMGMTPLSAAVRHAAEVLRASEQKATVILVSDGEETCNLDPCAVGAELARNGIDFTAHVIGFDVSDPAHQAQLRCLAENTGGRYFNATDARELGEALTTAVQASTTAAAEPEPPTDDRETTQWYMVGVDLYESDYDNFPMQPGDTARTCQQRCADDERCEAYTFTVPGFQSEHGHCWLKQGSPWKRLCPDCVSGAKPGVKVYVDEGFEMPPQP